MTRTAVLLIPLFVVTSATAQAEIVFQLGNNPQPDQENVLLNSGDTGTTIFGEANQTGTAVQFSSTTDDLLAPSSGQARIEALDGLLNNISISVPNGSFLSFIGNPFQGTGEATITVVANEVGGGTSDHIFNIDLGNGQNFFTLFAINGETIANVTIDAANGFSDLRQPRISGAEPNVSVVPEPGPLVMLMGVVAVASIARLIRRD